jgi:hypothetical protein
MRFSASALHGHGNARRVVQGYFIHEKKCLIGVDCPQDFELLITARHR